MYSERNVTFFTWVNNFMTDINFKSRYDPFEITFRNPPIFYIYMSIVYMSTCVALTGNWVKVIQFHALLMTSFAAMIWNIFHVTKLYIFIPYCRFVSLYFENWKEARRNALPVVCFYLVVDVWSEMTFS